MRGGGGESVNEEFNPALFSRIDIDDDAGVLLSVGLDAFPEGYLESQLLEACFCCSQTC